MSQRLRSVWLPHVLFWLATGAATVLLGLVVACPWLDLGFPLWGLFARDSLVRQTAVASALGLYVTAGVFFRPVDKARGAASRPPKPPPPPVPVVGA